MKNQDRAPSINFLSGLSVRGQHLISAIILLILPVILFNATVIGGKKIVGSDIVQWRAAAESVIEYEEEHGEEALWVENMFSGMPAYVVSYSKSFFHIDNLIRKTFKSIYPAAHYWLLLFGCYLFFILQGARPFSAVLGAIFIGITTYIPIILGAGHNSKFITIAYIPWMTSGYWVLTKTKNRWWGLFIFALALTLLFRGSHPQIIYYFLYLMIPWWLYDTYSAYNEGEMPHWLRINGFIITGIVLATISNIQPYWSIYEYSPYTIRGGSALSEGSGLSADYAFRWSQGFGEMITLLMPDAYGGASGQAYWGSKPGTSGPHYFGAIAFILFLAGLIFSKRRRKYVFLGTGVLAMLFALGHHFSLFNKLMFNIMPYLNKFRAPETWLILTIFCFTTIAVYGIDELIDLVQKRKLQQPKKLYTIGGIALGIGVLFSFATTSILSFENPEQRRQIAEQVARQNNTSVDNPQVQQYTSQIIEQRLKPERIELAKSDAVRYLLLSFFAFGLIYLFYRNVIGAKILLASLILLASFDMITVGKRYISENAIVDESVDAEQIIKSRMTPADQYVTEHIQADGYPYRVFPLDSNPFNNAVPAYFYPSVGGYTGAKLSLYQDLIEELLFSERGLNFSTLNMLNVKYITASRNLPFSQLEEVFSNKNHKVYRNSGVLPKAFYVDSLITVSTSGKAMNIVKQPAFDPGQAAVVESGTSIQTVPDTTADIRISNYNAKEITIHTRRGAPGFMVLSEIYYPRGWNAYIDGDQVRIYKTNYVLRGIEIPGGEHEVTFRFEPVSHIWGSRIAWAGNLITLGLGLFLITGYIKQKYGQDTDEA